MTDDFIEVLNRLLEIDPENTRRMIDEGRFNSLALANADYEKTKGIVIYVDKAYTYMSMLGVINSVLRKHGKELLTAVYHDGKIVNFGKYNHERPSIHPM